jgi:hypothetical protein
MAVLPTSNTGPPPRVDPQLARNSSLRPSAIGRAVNRCLQTHFEDIGHAPLNRFFPSSSEQFCFPLKWLVFSPLTRTMSARRTSSRHLSQRSREASAAGSASLIQISKSRESSSSRAASNSAFNSRLIALSVVRRPAPSEKRRVATTGDHHTDAVECWHVVRVLSRVSPRSARTLCGELVLSAISLGVIPVSTNGREWT